MTKAAGLAGFFNKQGTKRKDYIIETVGGGAAFFDYDNDGWLDILMTRGADMDTIKKGGESICALYRNNHDGTFSDLTEKAGLAGRGWGMGLVVADYDDDGNDDILITGYGRNYLYRNNGGGSFTDVTEKSGLISSGMWNAGAVFLDYNLDGHLDVYLARYVDFSIEKPFERRADCNYKGLGVYCGPQGQPAQPHALFRNNGDGTFKEVSEEAGLRQTEGTFHGLGAISFDYNNDGFPDIYVCNDSSPNLLRRNDGKGHFTNVATELGVAFSADGMEMASMGVDAGDLLNRGLFDIFITNFSGETKPLYRNLGKDGFEEVSWSSGMGQMMVPYLSWAVQMRDFDNDGWLDLFVVSGHVYPEVDTAPVGTRYLQRLLMFRNLHNGKFEDVGGRLGEAFQQVYPGRGAAVGDYNHDGALDILINNMDAGPTLLKSSGVPGRHWLDVLLVRQGRNRNSIGARVYLKGGGTTQMRELMSATGYFGGTNRRLHFGLDSSTQADEITIVWPGGKKQTLANIKADQLLTVNER